jgi:outer membrane protein assembly factor BamD
VEYYPANDRAPEAEAKIKELNNRLAKKQYDTAQLYSTMEYYKAAIFYFDDVIEKFHDTEYAPLAYLGKVEALIARKKFREAETEINEFIQKFPNSVLRSRADKLKEGIDRQVNKDSTAAGRDSGVAGGQRSDSDSLSQKRP